MLGAETAPTNPSEVRSTLRDLQGETILLVLPALYLLSFPLLVVAPRLADPSRATEPCLLAFWLGVGVLALRRASHLASAWALVLGCIAVDLLVVIRLPLEAALCLLALPAGLAALFVSITGGVLTAAACSVLLALAPPALLPVGASLRAMTLIVVWGTVGLIWLTLRPLVTTLEWSWSGYQQSRSLLEQARDQRVQLKQALVDLADANLQLTRLNRLAGSLRQAAEDARRVKEQFVANVSHELRTPLNMIVGFSEMILESSESYGSVPTALLADLDVIQRNAQHLASLIDDVLDLSQIEAGRAALTKEHVALAEIVESAVVAVRPLYAQKKLHLETDVPADLSLFCDRTRLREVLLNLLMNAGRFTERGGVRVRVWQDGEDVVVGVADSGPGIALEDQARLFQPFQQLDNSIRRRHGGTGLGLTISKSFVELHGGKMWVESERGRGSTFFFRLPQEVPTVAEPGATRWLQPDWEYEQPTHRPLAPARPVRRRLVVLEGGRALQRLLTRHLDDAEIVPVTSLAEAAQELARVPAQALLVNRPSAGEALANLDGASMLPEGTPAVVCSLPDPMEAAGALGAADYLVKPIAKDALLAALERLQLKGKTVLIVDDEPDAQRLFRRMLVSAGRGYRVLRAGDGRQALSVLRAERPDVVLLDLVMPDMDGFQFLAAKRADRDLYNIPVVLISARDPAGQPIVAGAVAAARPGGLSAQQLLKCIEALSGILSATGQTDGQGRTETRAG